VFYAYNIALQQQQSSINMQNITQQHALNLLQQQQNAQTITAQQVQALLNNVSVTFAQIQYVTQVATASAHKLQTIYKVTTANVMLASNIKAHTQLYARKVQRSAKQFAQNAQTNINNFTAQKASFTHNANCFSLVHNNNNNNKIYLYCIYNNAKSVYLHNNVIVNKQHVAQYLTAYNAKKLLSKTNTVHNVANNITHNVHARTISLQNIVSIKARKQLLTVNT
jgi:hypothetical protein